MTTKVAVKDNNTNQIVYMWEADGGDRRIASRPIDPAAGQQPHASRITSGQ
jgi:hypothetical protein